MCQSFFCGWDVAQRLADVAPLFAAVNIDQQRCVQSDVLSVHPGVAMYEAVGLDHLRSRVTQDRELMVHDGVPDSKGVFAFVNADGNNPCVEGVKFLDMLRELAQSTRAIGSPVPAIEN